MRNKDYIDYFLLDKNLSITLVSGYDVAMRNAIITRWQQLEKLDQKRFKGSAVEFKQLYLDTWNKALAVQNDPLMHPDIKQYLIDDLQNDYLVETGREKTLRIKRQTSDDETPLFLGVVEIYKRLRNVTLTRGLDISAGKRVAQHFKPTKVERLVNGEMRQINAYPQKDWESIAAIIDVFLQEREEG